MIIPAWNEEDALPGTLAELASVRPDLDVLVVSDIHAHPMFKDPRLLPFDRSLQTDVQRTRAQIINDSFHGLHRSIDNFQCGARPKVKLGMGMRSTRVHDRNVNP